MSDSTLTEFILTVDRGEAEAGRMVASKAQSADVKAFARSMVTVHTSDMTAVMGLTQSPGAMAKDSAPLNPRAMSPAMSGGAPPSANGMAGGSPVAASGTSDPLTMLKGTHSTVMTSLNGAGGAAFDRVYIDAMVAGHGFVLKTLRDSTEA